MLSGKHGLGVPDDLALVAFDDLPPTYVIDPFLTVAAQSAYEMGQIATRLLLQRMRWVIRWSQSGGFTAHTVDYTEIEWLSTQGCVVVFL